MLYFEDIKVGDSKESSEEYELQAEEIIERYVDDYMGWLRSLDAIELIQDFRCNAEKLRDEVLQKALRQLNKGKSPQEAMQFLARTLTNKLLHTPSSQLRQAGFNGQMELLDAANTIFQLKKIDNNS